MEPFIFILIIAGLIAAGYYQKYNSEVEVVKRKLKNETLLFLGDFKDGEVARFNGKLVFVDEPITAPFSKRPCAFYFVQVLEQYDKKKEVVIEEGYKVRYLIQDGEYYAFINTINLKCHLVEDGNYSSGTWNDPPGHLQEFMLGHGFDSTTLLGFNKSLSYTEGILEENERVSVHGKGTWKEAEELDLPESYGKVLEITSPVNEFVYLSDYPGSTRGQAQKKFEHVKLYNQLKEEERL